MSTLLLLGSLLVFHVLLTALMIRLVSAWLGGARARFGWSLFAALLLAALGVAQAIGVTMMPTLAGGILVQGAAALLACLCIWLCVGTTALRSFFVLLATLVPVGVGVALVILIVKPYALEAFVVPSNNMAPAVVGHHRMEKCPKCGGGLILPMPEPGDPREGLPDFHRVAMCENCLQVVEYDHGEFPPPADIESARRAPDRILVNKLLTPQRWDIIEFRYPPQPETKYIMRLVALPGERVFLKDGAVWVNGAKLEMPPELNGLRYGEDPGGIPTRMGTEDAPLALGPADHAVLGDFTARSQDSRYFGAVPGGNIEGVVTLRYWPMERWKILRWATASRPRSSSSRSSPTPAKRT